MFVKAELSKAVDGGIARMQSWIPEKLGIQGAVVNLKDTDNGEWTYGWTIDSATKPAMEFGDINNRSRDYKKTRIASDI